MPAYASETVTVSNVVKTLTAATYAGKHKALVTVEAASIRWDIGTNPVTAANGHVADEGDQIELTPEEIPNFRAIREGAVDGKLQVTYEG